MRRRTLGGAMLKSNRILSRTTTAAAVSVVLAVISYPVDALVISPTFDSSITGAPNAAQIENSINTSINAIQGRYSDPGTVNILFRVGPAVGSLAMSFTGFYFNPYTTYTALLASD